jgi:hypothetical protein
VCTLVLNAYIERCVHCEKKVETERAALSSVACSFRGNLLIFSNINKERKTGRAQQYIHIERDMQHSKRECSILNEVFKIGNSTHSSTGVGRGGLFNFQT